MSEPTTQAQPNPSIPISGTPPTRLRLWPGVVLVALLWAARAWTSIGEFAMYKFFIGMFITPLVVLVGLVLWWLFASRLRWSDRFLIVGTFVAVTAVTMFVAHESFRGMALMMYGLPAVATGSVAWLAVSFALPWSVRRAGVLAIYLATGVFCCLLRIDGMDGAFNPKFSWRSQPTAEQKFLATMKAKPEQPSGLDSAATLSEQPGDWPGFRGPNRDSRLSGVRIKTDWGKSPPRELWHHAIGPGWSSFAVIGDRIFTQEQRGDDEYVVCYDAASGVEVWAHRDATRFFELAAGPGPRATPTFHAGRLYAFGANGRLNCLDAASGKQLWFRDVTADTKATVPQWGYASSPLVVQGLVAVFAGAPNGKTVAAYDEKTGKPAWTAGVGPASDKPPLSYCSAELASVEGVQQILMATDAGLSAFEPASGKECWHYAWTSSGVPRIVQPAMVGGSDVLIGTGIGVGTRQIHVGRNGQGWLTEERWSNRKFRPYFNDFVVAKDHFYGFDGNRFMCLALKDGSEAWQFRGYGSGQVLLLADQELLLVMSEEGDAVLLSARPDKHEELCRFKAIEGKTWNHPVIAHGKLFVRNGEEIACFKLGLLDEAVAAR